MFLVLQDYKCFRKVNDGLSQVYISPGDRIFKMVAFKKRVYLLSVFNVEYIN